MVVKDPRIFTTMRWDGGEIARGRWRWRWEGQRGKGRELGGRGERGGDVVWVGSYEFLLSDRET